MYGGAAMQEGGGNALGDMEDGDGQDRRGAGEIDRGPEGVGDLGGGFWSLRAGRDEGI